MKNSGFHKKEFSESTRTKLVLYREYLKSWLPVFLNRPDIFDIIQVYDFFAGPGTDAMGNDGSPLIAVSEIEAALETNKERLSSKLCIRLILNDSDEKKAERLRKAVGQRRFEVNIHNESFAGLFALERSKMKRRGVANLIFIDQFGISEITKEVFEEIASIHATDVLFFTSSAIVNRMKDHPSIQSRIPSLSAEELNAMNGKNVHRILSQSYQRWLPTGFDYYLCNFSLKTGANVYGLVFGSRHILGIRKFLDVAWKQSGTGDANYDIDSDHIDARRPSLFRELDKPTKLVEFCSRVKTKIQQKQFRTNFDLLRFAVENGMLPKHAKEAFQQAIQAGELPKQSLGSFADSWKKECQTEILYYGDKQ
jgi:three-Cys-motif partner protein